MDNRTDGIREGAGLDESRLNQDFIDLMKKWSSPALFVIAAIVIVYSGRNYLQKRHNARVNKAFEELASVDYTVANPSPVTIAAIRNEYGDVRGIKPITALREADVYLESAIRGVAPGSEPMVDEQGQSLGQYSEEDVLDESGRAEMLDKAEALYRQVAESDEGGDGWDIHRLGAEFGLAAVAESRGDAGAADSAYTKAEALAQKLGYQLWAAVAKERQSNDVAMSEPAELISKAALPVDPVEEPEADSEAEPGIDAVPPADGVAPADEPDASSPPAGEALPADDSPAPDEPEAEPDAGQGG